MYEKSNGVVSFIYDKDELFEFCTLQSSYLSRSMKNNEGVYIGEDLALTEDERDAFDECIRNISVELWNCVAKMCIDASDAVEVENDVMFKFRDNGCNDRALKIVDGEMRDVLVYGVLKGWFLLCGNIELFKYCGLIFSEKLNNLWNDLFLLRSRL